MAGGGVPLHAHAASTLHRFSHSLTQHTHPSAAAYSTASARSNSAGAATSPASARAMVETAQRCT